MIQPVHTELLQKLVNFQTTGAVALSELGHGSNPSLIEVSRREEIEERWRKEKHSNL